VLFSCRKLLFRFLVLVALFQNIRMKNCLQSVTKYHFYRHFLFFADSFHVLPQIKKSLLKPIKEPPLIMHTIECAGFNRLSRFIHLFYEDVNHGWSLRNVIRISLMMFFVKYLFADFCNFFFTLDFHIQGRISMPGYARTRMRCNPGNLPMYRFSVGTSKFSVGQVPFSRLQEYGLHANIGLSRGFVSQA